MTVPGKFDRRISTVACYSGSKRELRISNTIAMAFVLGGLLCQTAQLTSEAAAPIPAFPGAEGFGATTAGGRGGKVIAVTNLSDDGPGSFRAACEAEGPRIVI